MRLISLLMALAGTLASCSTLGASDVPGCHGQRRPANPHGSVLAPAAVTPAPTVAPAASPVGGCGRPGR